MYMKYKFYVNDYRGLSDDAPPHTRKPPSKEDSKTILDHMIYTLKLPTPDLVLSVIGSAKAFKMPQRIKNEFQRRLISIALRTDAWIITSGTNSGVMKEVGDAVDNYRYEITKRLKSIACIGITSWYFITDYEQLQSEWERAPTRLNHIVSPIGEVYQNNPQLYRVRHPTDKNEKSKSCPLDPNHTHFILLEDVYGPDDNIWRKSFFGDRNPDLTVTRNDLTLKFRDKIEKQAITPTDP
ncbi:unnamed protein product, partial [Didymodactylos carnosus]